MHYEVSNEFGVDSFRRCGLKHYLPMPALESNGDVNQLGVVDDDVELVRSKALVVQFNSRRASLASPND